MWIRIGIFRRGCIKQIHIGEGDAVSFRPGALRDAGMLPLSSRESAKGGTQIPQTRFAQTVRYLRPNAVTRELRGTRSPDQGTPGWKLTAGSVENTVTLC